MNLIQVTRHGDTFQWEDHQKIIFPTFHHLLLRITVCYSITGSLQVNTSAINIEVIPTLSLPSVSVDISIESSAQNILFLLRLHQIQFCPAPAQPGPRLIYSPVILLSLALTLNLNVKYVAITFDIQSQFVSMMSYCPGGRGSGSSRQSEPPSNQCWVHGERVDARLVDVR